LEEELETLNASYQERTTKEMLPSWMVVVSASIPTIKMEIPLEDHEVNAAYWYHS
jgi:hypothetical protein